ncbi:putative nuclease HARBI1 [Merluccius polli]|uniref:Nuclease HARBI1 n=1 Tax=Merluccius polli TaxID=89951 RepID=A0AA47M0U2_MERPO|nr:putative nuclease HARBI1 [Merluccius polli]
MFGGCSFQTNVYGTFHSHKNWKHNRHTLKDFKPGVVITNGVSQESSDNPEEEALNQDDSAVETDHACSSSDVDVTKNLPKVIEQHFAAALLKLEHFAHVPGRKIDDFLEELHYLLSSATLPLSMNILEGVFQKHSPTTDKSVITEVATALCASNPLLKAIGKGGPLSTSYPRKQYYKESFKVVEPIEYILDAKEKISFQYVPVLKSLQQLFDRRDAVDKVVENHKAQQSSRVTGEQHTYKSSQDGSFFQENSFLSGDELRILVRLYIDDFEICNPLGTSRKKHKLCGIYWTLNNFPPGSHSSLSSIYLAVLCKTEDVKKFGYNHILHPLLQDMTTLEQEGVFVPLLGRCLKGTIQLDAADNLGAHGLADFKGQNNSMTHVKSAQENGTSCRGVKSHCVITKTLAHFKIGHLVPGDEMAWQILLDLKDIVELVVAPKHTDESIAYLEGNISEHRQKYQELFPDVKLLPKHHYLEHYPQLIRMFGPLVVQHTNCFKNVPFSLAIKHQLMISYHLISSSFEKTALEITNVSTVPVDVLKQEIAQTIEQNFPGTTEVHLTKCMSSKGVHFNGMIVAHGSTSGLPDFGEILQICVVHERLFFMLKRLSGRYREHFRAFELSACPARILPVLVELGELADYYPLADYFAGPLRMTVERERSHGMASLVKLRIILGENNSQRLILPDGTPESVAELAQQIKTVWNRGGFQASIHGCGISDALAQPDDSSSLSSGCSFDTDILSSPESTSSRSSAWPVVFQDTELQLDRANAIFKATGTLLNPDAKLKSAILNGLAETIVQYKMYLSDSEFEDVAEALISKHPCLKEPGSVSGYGGWKTSLKYKLGNYRTKLRGLGWPGVTVNALKHKPDGKCSPAYSVRRPKKAEVNYCPAYPTGETAETLEKTRVALLSEVQKINNDDKVTKMMDNTFALRREEVVREAPMIADFKTRWPALFHVREVSSEFKRITTMHLQSKFFSELDAHSVNLLKAYAKKGGAREKNQEHHGAPNPGMAGVVGAVDGTHIQIIAPSKDEDVFVNRNESSLHSTNTQIVFDATFNIIDVVAKWPAGSTHPRILMGSGLRREAPCTSWVSCWVTAAIPARRLDTSQSTSGSTVKSTQKYTKCCGERNWADETSISCPARRNTPQPREGKYSDHCMRHSPQPTDDENVGTAMAETVFGIFVMRHEGAEPGDNPEDVRIILEGVEVLDELGNVPFAVAMLLALVVDATVPILRIWQDFRLSRRAMNSLQRLLDRGQDHGWGNDLEVLIYTYWLAHGLSYRVVSSVFSVPKATVHSHTPGGTEHLEQFEQGDLLPTGRGAASSRRRGHAFANVVGAIDGSHIRIKPPQLHRLDYLNYENFYSINMQAICDAKGKFLDIYVGYPGYPPPGYIFLGDGGYPCLQTPICLLTPFKEPHEDKVEVNPFPGPRSQAYLCQAYPTCAFLHNVCLDNGDTLDPDEDITRDDLDPHPPQEQMGLNETPGNHIRDTLAAQVSMIKANFMAIAGMPGVVGAIDGTHVQIIAPSKDEDCVRQ